MYGDGVVCADGFFVPDLLVDLVDGEDFSGVFGQQQKNVVLDRSQIEIFGKLSILAVSLPVILALLETLQGFLV